MAKLEFDGKSHVIGFIDKDGKSQGSWVAYNNTDSHATIRHLPNGTYSIQDKSVPYAHKSDADGPYGSYGIIRFNVSGHPGIGVHSGRANARHLPGPQHPTMGCIRTTDEAMGIIQEKMEVDQLETITISNNVPLPKKMNTMHHIKTHSTAKNKSHKPHS